MRGIWYDRCYFGRQTCKSGRERSINAVYGVARVVYRLLCYLQSFIVSRCLGCCSGKNGSLTPESEEQLKKMGTDRLRAKLTKAGYEEAQVFDMGRTELLDAMAKAMLNEELMQEASQAPLPADESGSWTSEVGMEAARLRELEMEERKAVREAEERKAIREAEERKAVREAEERKATMEAEVRKAAMEAEARKAEAEERRAEQTGQEGAGEGQNAVRAGQVSPRIEEN